jgi:uncharacterized membrane protein
MKFQSLTAALVLALIWSGCQYKNQKESETALGGSNSTSGTGPGQSIPGFSTIQSQILAPKCYECHSNSGGNRAGINLETYQKVKSLAQAIQNSVASDFMPLNRSPLTTAQKQILAQWVAAGAPENPVLDSPTPPDAEAPTPEPSLDWATVNTLVIEPSCLGCHTSPANKGGVNLETYRNALDEIRDIEDAVRTDFMPLRGSLSPEQKKLILNWIAAGAPEFSKH